MIPQEKKTFFNKLNYKEKKTHLVKMLEAWNGKVDFLTLIYKYVSESDDTVDESVWTILYEMLIDIMEKFAKITDEKKKEKIKAMYSYIDRQSKKDKKDSENILKKI